MFEKRLRDRDRELRRERCGRALKVVVKSPTCFGLFVSRLALGAKVANGLNLTVRHIRLAI
jgi:hypothetical protein